MVIWTSVPVNFSVQNYFWIQWKELSYNTRASQSKIRKWGNWKMLLGPSALELGVTPETERFLSCPLPLCVFKSTINPWAIYKHQRKLIPNSLLLWMHCIFVILHKEGSTLKRAVCPPRAEGLSQTHPGLHSDLPVMTARPGTRNFLFLSIGLVWPDHPLSLLLEKWWPLFPTTHDRGESCSSQPMLGFVECMLAVPPVLSLTMFLSWEEKQNWSWLVSDYFSLLGGGAELVQLVRAQTSLGQDSGQGLLGRNTESLLQGCRTRAGLLLCFPLHEKNTPGSGPGTSGRPSSGLCLLVTGRLRWTTIHQPISGQMSQTSQGLDALHSEPQRPNLQRAQETPSNFWNHILQQFIIKLRAQSLVRTKRSM